MNGQKIFGLFMLLAQPSASLVVPDETLLAALAGLGVGALSNRLVFSTPRTPLDQIVVRLGASKYGVGLICVQDVPEGGRICGCEARYSRTVPLSSLARLPLGVRSAIHELFDCCDDTPGMCNVPLDYEQALPLISFINHSPWPTCSYDEDSHAIVASRPMRAGDEATVDYLEYQEEHSFTYRHAKAGFPKHFAKTAFGSSSAYA